MKIKDINFRAQLFALITGYFIVSIFLFLFPMIPEYLPWIFGAIGGLIIFYKIVKEDYNEMKLKKTNKGGRFGISLFPSLNH